MGKIYTRDLRISSFECTPDYRVQPTAVLNYFQETSMQQSDLLGVGQKWLDAQGLAWFLVKYQVHFHRYPKYTEALSAETEALAFDRFAAHRRFAIRDKSGTLLVEAETQWMLLNRLENKLMRLEEVEALAVYGCGTAKNDFKLRRLEKVPAFTNEKCFQIRYLDIDFNAHVNHVKYLAWAIETLPLEVVKTHEIAEAKIIYKNQGYYGDTITVKTEALTDDRFRMDIVDAAGTLLTQLELRMRPIAEVL